MYYGTRRIEILRHWLKGPRNGVSLPGLLCYLCAPTKRVLGNRKIARLERRDGYHICHLKGIERPFYYPSVWPFDEGYQVIKELMYPDNWHYYERYVKVARGDTVLDCGAGEGLFSLLVHDRCTKVYAVEPLMVYRKALALTFKGCENVEILPFALGESKGEAMIDSRGIGSRIVRGGDGTERIAMTTVDELFHDQDIAVAFIKADLEGYEPENAGRGSPNHKEVCSQDSHHHVSRAGPCPADQ